MGISLHSELSAIFARVEGQLSSVRRTRGAARRVDALTLVCRWVLRSSSLCYIGGQLHRFDSRVYVPVEKSEIMAVLDNILVDMGVSPTEVRKMSDMPLSVIIERSFSPVSVLCFTNGVLDLPTMAFSSAFSPERPVTETMAYPFDPKARCPMWEAFLEEVLPDGGERAVLQEFFGMVYLDRTKLSVEKFAVLMGQGANGKSVIFEVIKRVLGADNVSTLDSLQLTSDKMLPYVSGKRLNFSPDVSKSSEFDSALKALVSGQEVTGRRIFSDAEKIKCPPLCFALNDMPVIRDLTPAFFRRMLLFRFDVRIPPERQDRSLVGKICSHDLPGIFNWIIAGRDRLVENGGSFTKSPLMDAFLEEAKGRAESERYPVKAYLDEKGLSIHPNYLGQEPVMVLRGDIEAGMGGRASKYQINAEMKRLGAYSKRTDALYYKLYEKYE